MPAWLSENKKRAMAKDEEYRRRLELMQDFEMPTASQCIKMTADGNYQRQFSSNKKKIIAF